MLVVVVVVVPDERQNMAGGFLHFFTHTIIIGRRQSKPLAIVSQWFCRRDQLAL